MLTTQMYDKFHNRTTSRHVKCYVVCSVSGSAHCSSMEWGSKSHVMSQRGASSFTNETCGKKKTSFLNTNVNTCPRFLVEIVK